MPTAVATPSRGATASGASRAPSGTHAFAPGDVLAERYRIVGLLGRGGMGEVYRADDLKLGQPVSLKFLPTDFASNPALLELFHGEVRHARQVSHPNVCRVYDIGEFEGRPFLTMEYVDGEDLASLLRRIGRLPRAKADQVARQLCAGLAAAHDRGVLHRDLKPSNVMIDGDGRVRITDFGLAVRAGDDTGGVAGTPAYMSPEQFDGKPVTAQSDLYSLGLVLYEIYTGKRAFEAATFVDWKSKHTSATPTSPSALERDVDDAVERVIMRCLEKDPSRRPASAIQLAAALPGGDPLAAALAAGETPSPEMVAAAGGEGALAARTAWSLLGGVALAVGAVLAIAPYSTDLGLARFTTSREVLRDRARQVAVRLGYERDARDSEAWFARDYDSMRYLALRKPSPVWRREIAAWGTPLLLSYRQDPRPMAPSGNNGRIEARNPPLELSGSVILSVDAAGRLRDFEAVPPQVDSTAASAAPDWSEIFTLAGLDLAAFSEIVPRWVPPVAFDARGEWRGVAPWDKSVPLEVSAAAWHGRPTYFQVRGPWTRPWRMSVAPQSSSAKIADVSFAGLFLVMMIAAVSLARRNLQLRRGDRRGALRLGVFMMTLGMVEWAFSAHHVMPSELDLTLEALGRTSVTAAFLALVYLALEPYVRRHLPELLIGWARVIEGRLRDPRVGRDVLIGALIGTVAAIVAHLANAVPTWINASGQTTIPGSYDALAGGRLLVAFLLNIPVQGLASALFFSGLYFLLRLLVRTTWIAVLLMIVIATLVTLGGENFLLETPGAMLFASFIALVTTRYGLLAAFSFWVFELLLVRMPLPIDFSAPYAAQTLVILGLMIAVALYAFRIALGSRPLFRMTLDE
jgi:hypothetical protein